MSVITRKVRFIIPGAVGLALLWLSAVACFPGSPTPAPEVAAPAEQVREVTAAPTLEPTVAPPSNTPTAVPTPTQASAVAEEEPTAIPEITEPVEAEPSAASKAIFDNIGQLEERAFSYLSELAEDLGPRTSGTDLELEAAEFLVQRLEELGYDPEVQDFSWDAPTASFSADVPEQQELEANTLSGTAGGRAVGPLVFVGLGKPGDMPSEGLEGKIALIERGEITFGTKVAQVASEGAVAAVIFNNVSGSFRGTLGGRSQIPAISLSRADGLELKELLDQGEVVEATVAVEDNAIPSRNLIAEIPGTGEGVIVLGAHYDTVPNSVGASDNASGMGALMAVAEAVAGRSFPFTLRFIAFGSEETGLHGSEYYVESLPAEDLDDIFLMINLDSVGSGAHLRVSGDRWAASHVLETANREALSIAGRTGSARGASDHLPFREAWVPIIYFQADDLHRINSPEDTMEHINPELLGDVTALVLDLLENADQLAGYGE
ncbi:MAG: M20/M25/M40 family metallo-hydrolase [Chloroflexi bacterium]|nr:M20/M25/M40 family metallo-hydrolase [Chloroflexota bacterium]